MEFKENIVNFIKFLPLLLTVFCGVNLFFFTKLNFYNYMLRKSKLFLNLMMYFFCRIDTLLVRCLDINRLLLVTVSKYVCVYVCLWYVSWYQIAIGRGDVSCFVCGGKYAA